MNNEEGVLTQGMPDKLATKYRCLVINIFYVPIFIHQSIEK